MNYQTLYLAKLEAEHFYHVYNRTNNKESLFRNDYDRSFFLHRFYYYLGAYAKIFAYCLLPNHFHFLIQIHSIEKILAHINTLPTSMLTKTQKKFLENEQEERNTIELMEKQFLRFFTSYSMCYNKFHNRKGNLFHRPFKRKEIESEAHFSQVVCYIHTNPVKHRIVTDFTDYPWSSYQSYLAEVPSELDMDYVWSSFGGKQAFIDFHLKYEIKSAVKGFEIEKEDWGGLSKVTPLVT